MRKVQQAKILELLETLDEAHRELCRQAARDILISLLADCQDFAVQIGQYVESIAGEGTNTVSLLEEYCNFAYRASLESDIGAQVKWLKTQIVKIKNSVRSELKPDKIEVVFFPYQFSMFDAFESVYFAAEADPNCNVFVVPIPWFDKLPNGKLGKMHYDGGEYPARIPVTNWKEYDVEARHPDIVYIHSPYDDGNHVTTIHPEFYSSRLRDCTDLLIYIPYFVCSNDVPAHFCTTAGCIYAHKTIVQSEKIRDTYIKSFKKTFGNRFGDPRDKFVALGSPKFDAAINHKPEDFKLPEAWRKLLFNREGAKKRVILYNTSIGAMLNGNEQYLKKLRSVLGIFSGRDDIVLWWRPHPLSEETYRTMRPQLLTGYEEIVTAYKRGGWGIFDDTVDLHRAVAWADAYYGDASSITFLFGVTGKPILLQDANAGMEDTLHDALVFNDFCDCDDFLYFTLYNGNGLVKIDKNTWKPECIAMFENEPREAICLFSSIVKKADTLYCFPCYAKTMETYYLPDHELTKIEIPDSRIRNVRYRFTDAVLDGELIYLVPYENLPIAQLNIKTQRFAFFDDFQAKLAKLNLCNEYPIFGKSLRLDGKLVLPLVYAPAVLIFDLATHQSNIMKVGRRNSGYADICYDGENCWLAPWHTDSIVKLNLSSGEYKELDHLNGGFSKIDYAYISIEYLNGYVWAFPYLGEQAIKIDVISDEISIADEFQEVCQLPSAANLFLGNVNYLVAKASNDIIYAYTSKNNSFIAYNTLTKERREEHIYFDKEQIEKMKPLRRKQFSKNSRSCERLSDFEYWESLFENLTSFINFILEDAEKPEADILRERQSMFYRNANSHGDGTAGRAIYEYSKGWLIG